MTLTFGSTRLPAGNYRFGLITGIGIAMSCKACEDLHEKMAGIMMLPPMGLINDTRDSDAYMTSHEALYHPELKATRDIIYVIWSIHHHGYYRNGGRGYSIDIESAQRFTLDQALPELTARAFNASPLSAYALVAAPENWPTADEATNAPACRCGHTILWHRNEFQPPPVGCEADECMCAMTPQQILAEIAAGQGRNDAAPAYVNHGTPAQRPPWQRAGGRDRKHTNQQLEGDRGIILGTCAHWWQSATVEPTEPLQVLERAGRCPHCGRPAAVIVGSWEEAWPEPAALDEVDPPRDVPDHVPLPFVAPDSATAQFMREIDAVAPAETAGGGREEIDPFANEPELTAAPAGWTPSIPITDPRPTTVRFWPNVPERPLSIVRPEGTEPGAPVPVCECGHLVARHQAPGCLDCECTKPYDSFADNALADNGNGE